MIYQTVLLSGSMTGLIKPHLATMVAWQFTIQPRTIMFRLQSAGMKTSTYMKQFEPLDEDEVEETFIKGEAILTFID